MGDQPTAPDPINCTANDIQLASVDNINIIEKSNDGITWVPASGQECDFPEQYIKFTASWHVLATAQDRYNVGLWFANEGQASALHGNCSASTLPNSPSPFFEDTDDLCGDINHDSTGTVSPDITVVAQCLAAPGTNQLNLPYCTSWDNNEAAGNSCNGPEDTVAGTPSKCNCDNSNPIPITVPPALEVIKALSPTDDLGLFDLLVNSVVEKADASNTDTTGKVGILTGTNTFGEAAGNGTDLADYSSAASCVLRGTQTAVSASKNGSTWTINGVTNGQDIVCTITNTLQNGHIIVDKVTNPTGDSQSFDFDAGGGTYADFALTDAAIPNDQELLAGAYSISETVPSGWDLTSGTCVSSIQDTETPASLELDANETITCTFTNTKKSHIIVDKVTNPTPSTQSFDFTAGGTGYTNFSLTDVNTPMTRKSYRSILSFRRCNSRLGFRRRSLRQR